MIYYFICVDNAKRGEIMYVFIKKRPREEDINLFKMQESVNEKFINFRINPNQLSVKERKTFIVKYKLEGKAISSEDSIFLAMPKP